MQIERSSVAPGYPGITPKWTASTKEGIGTAYNTSCRVWFTLSHGIINEIYYPRVDTPNTRDLQLLITDGESFFHEERSDLVHEIEYPEHDVLCYRITNSDPEGRYHIVKEIIADPHQCVVLTDVEIVIEDPDLEGRLKVYALLAPHIAGLGQGNNATWSSADGRKLLHAWREGTHLVFGCSPDFTKRSVGFVGVSDGWQDIARHFGMEWQYSCAEKGNVALTGEIDLSSGYRFVLGVGMGLTHTSAATALLQSLATPFSDLKSTYVRQWQRSAASGEREMRELYPHSGDEGSLARLSRCILLAHEDKIYQGAMVASVSIPWGEAKDDRDLGGYHLVWPRDLLHSSLGLLAAGQTETPLRSLIWLSCVQESDGGIPQNCWINGEAYWTGRQLDEVAVPILLAWHVKSHNGLKEFDPWPMISRTLRYLILHGPVTEQERWEENSGYSPSTLAAVIAAMVCAGEFAKERSELETARFVCDYADWMAAHMEDWTVTVAGTLLEGKPVHYIRITPADADDPAPVADPDNELILIKNGGGIHPAREIVGFDFLALARLGIRPADSDLMRDSVAVCDHVIKHELPGGPCWRRYPHDGYGQHVDGRAFDETGDGGCWPIMTGERGHYELACGNDPELYIRSMENFANAGGMICEQMWYRDDLPNGRMQKGKPAGSAMPLCWSHAEYLALLRSRQLGVPSDRPKPVYQRYAANSNPPHAVECWTPRHQTPLIWPGKPLRIILGEPFTLHWSTDEWATHQVVDSTPQPLGLHAVDLGGEGGFPLDTCVSFSFPDLPKPWGGRDYSVTVHEPRIQKYDRAQAHAHTPA